MQTLAWLPSAAIVVACALLAACGGEVSAPAASPAGAPAPVSDAAPARPPPADDAARLVAAANAAFAAGRFVSPAGDNALQWFAAAREADPAHAGAVEALVDLYPIALAAAERALDAGDAAEARRIVDLLDRAQPDSLGTRGLRERLQQPAGAQSTDAEAPRTRPILDAARPLEAPASTRAAATPTTPDAAPTSPAPAVAARQPPPQPTTAGTVATADPAASQVRAAEAAGLARAEPRPAAPASDVAVAPPRVVSRVEPAYPQLARQRRIEGWVELEFVVGTDGTPSDIRVVESSPTAIFDTAATRALQRWRFEPARRGAVAEPSRTRTRIAFRLG